MTNQVNTVNIIQECMEGNSTAQKQLYEMYRVRLFTVCLRYMQSKEDAEDIYQDAWVRTFKYLNQYNSEKGPFYGWLRKIFVNKCLEELRKRKIYFTEINESVIIPTGSNNALSDISMQDMMKLLHRMPLGYRTVFNMYVIEGYSHKEIAKELNISPSTSKTQLMRAKALLREKVSLAFAM